MMANRGGVYALIMVDMYLGLNIPANLPLVMREKLLAMMGELDICTIPDTITPITHVTIVDFGVYLTSR